MRTISLALLQKEVSARKAALGITDTAAEIEIMRNKGDARTPAKRELLRRAGLRAVAAGQTPIASYF